MLHLVFYKSTLKTFVYKVTFFKFRTYMIFSNIGARYLSAPELKTHVSFSDCLFSVCPSVCNYFPVFIFFSRTTDPISIKLGTKHFRVKEIHIYSKEGPCHFPREIIKTKRKYIDEMKNLAQAQPNLGKKSLVEG